jgi:tetraacyldisaccharide 4'-kinase
MGALWMSMGLGDCYNLVTGDLRSIESFRGTTAHAVAGIGNPERFFRQLQEAGITVYRHAFIDHHRFVESDLDFADGAPVLMTEKDGIKCRNMEKAGHVWVVRAQVELEPAIFRQIDETIEGTDNTSRR